VDMIYDKGILYLAMRAGLEETGGWVTSEYTSGNNRNSQPVLSNRGERTFDKINHLLNADLEMIPDQKFVDSVNAQVAMVIEKYAEQFQGIDELKVFAEASKARAIDIFLIKRVQALLEREEKKNTMRGSAYQGEVGQKITVEVEVVDEKHGVGEYGPWSMFIFKDSAGNMFKKFGTLNDRFKVGEKKYKFVAPIKKFEEYQEIKYTILGGPLSKAKN
jgi:hypothetical protein